MIAIGSDHGGYLLKEEIKKHLKEKGYEFKDFGTDSTASCDYPVYAEKVCRAVQSGECEKGILICGTGIGMSMCANKCKESARQSAATTFPRSLQENTITQMCFASARG